MTNPKTTKTDEKPKTFDANYDVRRLLESTYDGHDDDHPDSPFWMDRNHDYGMGPDN